MENSIFESESIRKTYFALSVPLVLGMVISIVYNITDTFFIALTRNTDLVAGVSLCAPAFTLLMGLGNIFGQGGSSLISRLLGRNDEDGLHRVSSFCFYAAIVFGFIAGAIMLLTGIHLAGYHGVIYCQAISDLVSAAMALLLLLETGTGIRLSNEQMIV